MKKIHSKLGMPGRASGISQVTEHHGINTNRLSAERKDNLNREKSVCEAHTGKQYGNFLRAIFAFQAKLKKCILRKITWNGASGIDQNLCILTEDLVFILGPGLRDWKKIGSLSREIIKFTFHSDRGSQPINFPTSVCTSPNAFNVL